MHNLFKKLAYILLILTIVNIPVQAFYAASSYCDDMQMEMQMAKQESSSHCYSQKEKTLCTCDNCKCDMCIILQANTQSIAQVISHYQVTADMAATVISPRYTQHYYNPLLRPPIV